MRHKSRFGGRVVLALAVCTALLTGCSLFGGDRVAEEGPPKIEVGANGQVKDSIASLTRKQAGYEITADVVALERYDKALRLTFVVTPRSNGSSDDLSSYYFSTDSFKNDVSNVYLLDSKHRRMYPVLRKKGDDCVCSHTDDGYPLDEQTVLFADYPVPPESVDQMTVVFGDLGPLPGVEIS